MPTPMTSGANPDTLDRRFSRIFDRRYNELSSMLPKFYAMKPGRRGPDERESQFGEFGNFTEFEGSVDYQSVAQGYDVTATYRHWTSGFQVEVTYAEDDLFNVVDKYPAKLATSAQRTRESHGAEMLVLGFSNNTNWYTHSEAVPLFSNSHTTTAPNVSTASGFDNLTTSAMNMTSVLSAWIQMNGFRNDRGSRIQIMPDELWYPPDLAPTAHEIMNSMGRPELATNAVNFNEGRFTGHMWHYLSDANDWWMFDSTLRKDSIEWFDRIPVEFGRAEDLDTITMKWRSRMRYTYLYNDWRCGLGAQVS